MGLEFVSVLGGLAGGMAQGMQFNRQMEQRDEELKLRSDREDRERSEYEGRRDYELARIRRENALAELNELQAFRQRDSGAAFGEAQKLMRREGEDPTDPEGLTDPTLGGSTEPTLGGSTEPTLGGSTAPMFGGSTAPMGRSSRAKGSTLRDGIQIPPDLMELRSRVTDPHDRELLDDEIIQFVEGQRMERSLSRLHSYAGVINQQASQGLLPVDPKGIETVMALAGSATTAAEVEAVASRLEELVNVAGHEYRVLQGRQMLAGFLSKATQRVMDSGAGGDVALDIQKLFLASLKPPEDSSPEELARYEGQLNDAIMMAAVLAGEQGPAAAQLLRKQTEMAQRAAEFAQSQQGGAPGGDTAQGGGTRTPQEQWRIAELLRKGDLAAIEKEFGEISDEELAWILKHARPEETVAESMDKGGRVAQPDPRKAGAASSIPGATDEQYAEILRVFELPPDTTREQAIEMLMKPIPLPPSKPVTRPGGTRGDAARRMR